MTETSGARAEIEFAAGELVRLLQRHLPGLVDSLHVVGSAADGDFRRGRSELDFVAVLCRPATSDDLEALTIVHRLYASDLTFPTLNGIWVTAADLASGPDAAADGPATQDGQIVGQARGTRNPMTWLALRQRPLTVLGQPPDPALLWQDPARLSSWICETVENQWAPWLQRSARRFGRDGVAMLGGRGAMRGVLGISRLHYTLATGRIASHTAAGDYALAAFDRRWERIIREALRIRRGQRGRLYASPLARRRDALDFVAMVVADIRRRYCASE